MQGTEIKQITEPHQVDHTVESDSRNEISAGNLFDGKKPPLLIDRIPSQEIVSRKKIFNLQVVDFDDDRSPSYNLSYTLPQSRKETGKSRMNHSSRKCTPLPDRIPVISASGIFKQTTGSPKSKKFSVGKIKKIRELFEPTTAAKQVRPSKNKFNPNATQDLDELFRAPNRKPDVPKHWHLGPETGNMIGPERKPQEIATNDLRPDKLEGC